MRFVKNTIDYGTAPEFNIGGIASVEQISPGQIRVSFFSTFHNADGVVENRIVAHHVWDRETWLGLQDWLPAARTAIRSEGIGIAPIRIASAH